MKKIITEKIEDGMILGREVCGPSGNVLVNKGSQLTAAMGRRLKNWGIPHIFIDGEEDEQVAEAADNFSPEELKNLLMEKFSNVIDNPIMKKFFVIVYQYRLQQKNK